MRIRLGKRPLVRAGFSLLSEILELSSSSFKGREGSLELLVGRVDDLAEVVPELFRLGVETKIFSSRTQAFLRRQLSLKSLT